MEARPVLWVSDPNGKGSCSSRGCGSSWHLCTVLGARVSPNRAQRHLSLGRCQELLHVVPMVRSEIDPLPRSSA